LPAAATLGKRALDGLSRYSAAIASGIVCGPRMTLPGTEPCMTPSRKVTVPRFQGCDIAFGLLQEPLAARRQIEGQPGLAELESHQDRSH
jgi:hypothetical protein